MRNNKNISSKIISSNLAETYDLNLDFEYPTYITHENNLINAFHLKQYYSIPFNNSCGIESLIPKQTQVPINVFEVLGNEVETLVNEEQPTGAQVVNWNAADLPTRVYFYCFQAGSFADTKKMILIK